MKQIFAISMSTGEYNSYNMEIVAITDDLLKGQAYVDEMNSTYAKLDAKMISFYNNEMKEWNIHNPMPTRSGYNLYTMPRWNNEIKITDDIVNQRRAEKERIESKNKEIVEKANEPIKQWQNSHVMFVKNWISINLTPEEQKMNETKNDNVWSIAPVKWL